MDEIRRVGFCPHCCNKAPQRLVHTQGYRDKGYSMADGKEDEVPSTYYVAVCETCGGILVYYDFADQLETGDFTNADLAWPQKKTLHKAVPKHIRQIYEEAAMIQEISPDAFAVQIRRSLEAICSDRGVEGRNLQSSLKALSDRGEIPPILAEFTDVLRLLGNMGAHWTGQRVHPLQTTGLDDFFRAVVEYIYVAPSKLKEFKDGLPQFRKFTDDNKSIQQEAGPYGSPAAGSPSGQP